MYTSLLFTGHMIDAEDREKPRFPAHKEEAVRKALQKQLEKIQAENGDALRGLAGGACGGDILFHELCGQLNIPTEMYLALPVAEFIKASVAFAGQRWVDRFEQLAEKLRVHILPSTDKQDASDSELWENANLWMLEAALEHGGKNMVLLALWDGRGGDGSGGTEHMIKVANNEGATTSIIDIKNL